MTWSLCMIVKNEEQVIKRCLDSVEDIFDEIVIVDTGSTDKTKEIISNYTDNVFDFKWVDDFGAARNFAFEKATSEYIMWLDADDVIHKRDLKKLRSLKKRIHNQKKDIYLLKYNIAFDSQENPTFSYYRERLIKNDGSHRWIDQVHEYIPLIGSIEYVDIAINHKSMKRGISDRNLNIYRKMLKNGDLFSPRNQYYYARELFEHQFYQDAIAQFQLFLNTKEGWVEDNIGACFMLYEAASRLEYEDANHYLFRSFDYDIPRKKTCCFLGNWYFNKEDYQKAIFWYDTALSVDQKEHLGFYEVDYDYFIPYLNLCVCYDRLGDLEKSYEYHRKASSIKPENKSILYNEEYFKNKLKD